MVIVLVAIFFGCGSMLLAAQSQEPVLRIPGGNTKSLRFTADGAYLFVERLDRRQSTPLDFSVLLTRYDLTDREFAPMVLNSQRVTPGISSDGATLARIRPNGLQLVDVGSGDVMRTLSLPVSFHVDELGPLDEIRFTDADRKIAILRSEPRQYMADVVTGEWHELKGRLISLAKSGRIALLRGNVLEVRDSYTSSRGVKRTLKGRFVGAQLSRDGRKLLLGERRVDDPYEATDIWQVLDVDAESLRPSGMPWEVSSKEGVYFVGSRFGARPVLLYAYDSGDGDSLSVSVYDVHERRVLFSHTQLDRSTRVILSPDGARLAFHHEDGAVEIQMLSGRREPRVKINAGDFDHLAVSNDGARLYTLNFLTDEVRSYNLDDGSFELSFRFEMNGIDSYGRIGWLDPDGKLLQIWNGVMRTLELRGGRLAHVDFDTGEVHIVDPYRETLLSTHTLPRGISPHWWTLMMFRDGHLTIPQVTRAMRAIVNVYVVDVTSGEWQTIEADEFSLPEVGRVAILRDHDQLELRTLGPADEPRQLVSIHDLGIRKTVALSLSGDGSELLIGAKQTDDADETAVTWQVLDTTSLAPVGTRWTPTGVGHYVYSGWLGNRPIAMYVGEDGIAVFDVGERSAIFSLPGVYQSEMALSSDGRWLALDRAGVVEVHDVRRLAGAHDRAAPLRLPRLVPHHRHLGRLNGLAISTNGAVVATAGTGGWVSLWDRASARIFRRIWVGKDPFISEWHDLVSHRHVALSQDGMKVMARIMSPDSAGLGVWNAANGEPLSQWDELATLHSFVDEDSSVLICDVEQQCVVRDFQYDVPIEILLFGQELEDAITTSVSLAPDASSVAFLLFDASGDQYIRWMRLGSHMWKRGVSSGLVTSIAALGDDRVAIAKIGSDGQPSLAILEGESEKEIVRATRLPIRSMIALDRQRLVIDNARDVLVISTGEQDTFAVLRRLVAWNQPADGRWSSDPSVPSLMTASDSGEWIAVAETSEPPGDVRLRSTTIDHTASLRFHTVPAWRVEFGDEGSCCWRTEIPLRRCGILLAGV